MKNIFEDIDVNAKDEVFNTLLNSKNVRIERIVSTGQVSEEHFWYDQSEDEFVILVQGEAIIEFENKSIKSLQKGDFINIPKHTKHRVTHTSKFPVCIWLAVFY